MGRVGVCSPGCHYTHVDAMQTCLQCLTHGWSFGALPYGAQSTCCVDVMHCYDLLLVSCTFSAAAWRPRLLNCLPWHVCKIAVAHIRDQAGGQWWRFDDDTVTSMGAAPTGHSADHGVTVCCPMMWVDLSCNVGQKWRRQSVCIRCCTMHYQDASRETSCYVNSVAINWENSALRVVQGAR